MGYLKEKYTKEYFLGSIDGETGQIYGNKGFESFREGCLAKEHKWFLSNLNLRGKVILDIGCGRGEVVSYCVEKGAKKVIGVDFSKDAIQIASEINRDNSNAKLIEVEAKDMNFFKNMFDVIFMFDVIEHIPDQEMQLVYRKVYSTLKKDGILILDTPFYNSTQDKDSSDFIPATKGMHCNKQTKEKLINDLTKYNFRQYSINVWGKLDYFSREAFYYANVLKFKEFLSRQQDRITHPRRTIRRLVNKLLRIKNE